MVSRNLKFRFTLVSYNILSQTLLNEHRYLYSNCNPVDLEWPRRGNRIVTELIQNRADIICLQEVESEHLRSLYRPRLARYGYECLFKKKTGYKIDGCAIFYKSRLFHLLSYKGIEFKRTDVINILDRDNIGIIAVLKPKIYTRNESPQLVIANTHLIFNPKRTDIKLAQLKLFLSEIEAISLKGSNDNHSNDRSYHPTILCGDMNSTPESVVNNFVTHNSTNDAEIQPGPNLNRDEISSSDPIADGSSDSCQNLVHDTLHNDLNSFTHSMRFKSVYPTKDRRGHRYVSTFSSCIVDYIFYTPCLNLESYRNLLTEDELNEIGPLPNQEFPSDHISLEAKFSVS